MDGRAVLFHHASDVGSRQGADLTTGMNVLTATLLTVAAAMAGAPIGASVLVTIASRHEDAAGSRGGKAPGVIAIAARRILDFHPEDGAGPCPALTAAAGRRRTQPAAQQVRQTTLAPDIARPRQQSHMATTVSCERTTGDTSSVAR